MAAAAWSTVSPTTLGTRTLRLQVISVTWDPISAWLATIGLVATTRFWLAGSQAVVVLRLSPRNLAAVRAVLAPGASTGD
jgi:hypothetical protein